MTAEQAKQIETEARKWSRSIMGVEISSIQETPREVDAYITGRTASLKEIERLESENAHLHAQNFIVRPEELQKEIDNLNGLFQAKDREIAELKAQAIRTDKEFEDRKSMGR